MGQYRWVYNWGTKGNVRWDANIRNCKTNPIDAPLCVEQLGLWLQGGFNRQNLETARKTYDFQLIVICRKEDTRICIAANTTVSNPNHRDLSTLLTRVEQFSDGKGRVGEWMQAQPSYTHEAGMSWSIVTSGPYMDMLLNVSNRHVCVVYLAFHLNINL
jgi:hypothetical protein